MSNESKVDSDEEESDDAKGRTAKLTRSEFRSFLFKLGFGYRLRYEIWNLNRVIKFIIQKFVGGKKV